MREVLHLSERLVTGGASDGTGYPDRLLVQSQMRSSSPIFGKADTILTTPNTGATSEMNLTDQELAYLDRFCYEVDHFLHGEGSIFQECPGHYQDLAATDFARTRSNRARRYRDPSVSASSFMDCLRTSRIACFELESAHGRSEVEPYLVNRDLLTMNAINRPALIAGRGRNLTASPPGQSRERSLRRLASGRSRPGGRCSFTIR